MKKILCTLISLVSAICFCNAQDTIVVSPVVGKVIDSTEKVDYRIMSYFSYKKFKHAVFIRTSDTTITIRATFKGDSVVERPIKLREYGLIKSAVEGVAAEERRSAAKNGIDTASFVRVETTDGAEIFGKLLSNDSVQVSVSTTSLGVVTISKSKISKMEVVKKDDVKGGKYWFENPNSTRYFVGPSAFNLKPGEGYYQNNYLLLNSVNVGITKNISIGGGFELLSTFAEGSGGPIYYFTPKIGFKLAKSIHAGGGLLYASVPDISSHSGKNRAGLGAGFAMLTFGDMDNNITLNGGYGFVKGEFSKRPMITFSGMKRIGRKTSLVTENWFVPVQEWTYNGQDEYKYHGFVSYGIRFFGESISVDLGFINNKDIMEVILIGVPYIDFVVKFGGKK